MNRLSKALWILVIICLILFVISRTYVIVPAIGMIVTFVIGFIAGRFLK